MRGFTAAAARRPVKDVVNSKLRVGVKAKATATTRLPPAVAQPPTTTNSCGDPDPIDEQAALALGYATNLVVGGGCGGGGGGGSTPPPPDPTPPDPVQLPPVIVITSPPTCVDFGNCFVTPPGPPPTIPVGGGGGGSNSGVAQNVAAFYKAVCIGKNESQDEWASRAYKACRVEFPAAVSVCYTTYTDFTIEISNGGIKPPPPTCPI